MSLKKVLVGMSDACHAVLKTYSATFNKTMSDVMYDFARSNIQRQSRICALTENMLTTKFRNEDYEKPIKIDKRVDKNCWGWMCNACNYYDKCCCGLYDGMWVPTETALKFPNLSITHNELQKRVRVYDHRNNKVWDPYTREYIDLQEPHPSDEINKT